MRALGFVLVSMSLGAACGERPALLRVADARQRTTAALAGLAKASDASNRAVMADASERSSPFVAEAEHAKRSLAADIDALRGVLTGPGFESERQLVERFEHAYASYRSIDDEILGLAGEDTNRKAQGLSFGAAASAADAVAASLDALRPIRGREWQVEAQKARAVTEAQRILALEAPHIAEAGDAAMDAIEGRMREAEARARRALETLRGLTVTPAGVDTAAERFSRLWDLNAEIVRLSRQNTNVRSLALALNEKGKRFVACEQALAALSSALEQRSALGAR
ncbi:MAG: hypothetical protein U0Q12_05025 [Vicinamibacterales bacterium]